MAKQDPINTLLTQNGSETHPADIAEVLHEKKTVSITPAPMPIAQAVDLYKRLDDAGKGEFLECFNPDDKDLLLKVLDEAGELIYTLGGLHLIVGTCVELPKEVEDPDNPSGEYAIKTDERTHIILLNLPLGDRYVPENKYPKVGDRVVIYAEGLHQDNELYIGYAEQCWLGKTDEEIESLKQMEGYYVVPATKSA